MNSKFSLGTLYRYYCKFEVLFYSVVLVNS
jgi:hypothetical protein